MAILGRDVGREEMMTTRQDVLELREELQALRV